MGVGELFTSITIIINNDDDIMSPKLIAIDVTVPGSISLTRSCVVLKRQKILTGFLLLISLYDSPMSLPHRVNICVTLVSPLFPFPNFAVTHPPVDLSVGDIRWQIAAE